MALRGTHAVGEMPWPRAATMGTLPIVDAVSKGERGEEKKERKKDRPKRSTSLSGKLRAPAEPPDLKVPGGGSSLCYLERERQ